MEEVLEQGQSVVVFTWYRDAAGCMHDAIQARHPEHDGNISELLTGDTKTQLRQQLVDRFQVRCRPNIIAPILHFARMQKRKSRVMVCTFGAGGVGLTMTAAPTVILVDRPWTPGDAAQVQ